MKVEELIQIEQWASAEASIAAALHLNFLPADPRNNRIIEIEQEASEFSIDEVYSAFMGSPVAMANFAIGLDRRFTKRDHGEEWNPREGNQQAGAKVFPTIGIQSGFLISYVQYFLYANRPRKELTEYLKRRRIPHAAKVAKDILEEYSNHFGGNIENPS